MPKILLAPSYGNPNARRHYHDTIEGWVRFEDDHLKELLTEDEVTGLREQHPDGMAHFWGARAGARRMDELVTGSVVLFTGDNKIKASGEVGFRFRNKPFADALWRAREDEDSFVHVYSLLNVRPIERHKNALLSMEGFSERDPLTGQRFVKPELVAAVLEEFRVGTGVADSWAEKRIAEELTQHRRARITPVERFYTRHTTRVIAASVTVTERVESTLVWNYLDFSGPDRLHGFTTHRGLRVDLYREDGDEVEILEAKSLATHAKVRQAVAQLLDYSVHSPRPVTRLAGLFPQRPDTDDLAYLHRLGIDCVHLEEGGGFTRVPAPARRRKHMIPVWRGL